MSRFPNRWAQYTNSPNFIQMAERIARGSIKVEDINVDGGILKRVAGHFYDLGVKDAETPQEPLDAVDGLEDIWVATYMHAINGLLSAGPSATRLSEWALKEGSEYMNTVSNLAEKAADNAIQVLRVREAQTFLSQQEERLRQRAEDL